jgi:hypothetical protein
LGLLNDVSTSSDEDVPEHHLPPHMVSGPSAVSSMAPPPASTEPPKEDSRERALANNPNPASAPSASTAQRVETFQEGTPAQSLQNATQPAPYVKIIFYYFLIFY